jgi:tetratricopeptide (TPR) repeat protein
MSSQRAQLLAGVEDAPARYHARLQVEMARPEPRKVIIAEIAQALGRAYRLLGDTAAAQPYLLQAAAAARENLEQARRTGPLAYQIPLDKRYHWGYALLACALKHWWAELPEATGYFQEAVAVFAEGQQEGIKEYAAERSHGGAMYGHIFLGNYAQARTAGQAYVQIGQTSSTPHPDLYIPETILVVIDDLERGTRAAYQHAEAALEACMVRGNDKLWGESKTPKVDVYELVQCRLRAAGTAEGEG